MAKHRDIIVRLTEPQYDALKAAVHYLAVTFEQDGPASVGMTPHVPRSLAAADDRLTTAWNRAGWGF